MVTSLKRKFVHFTPIEGTATGVTDILALRPRGKAVIRRLKHHSVILPVQKVFISIKFKILKIF